MWEERRSVSRSEILYEGRGVAQRLGFGKEQWRCLKEGDLRRKRQYTGQVCGKGGGSQPH